MRAPRLNPHRCGGCTGPIQHDAAEFVGVLLDYLENELPDTALVGSLKGFLSRKLVTIWFSQQEGHVGEPFRGTEETTMGPMTVDISQLAEQGGGSGGGRLEDCLAFSCAEAKDDVFSDIEAPWGQTDATRTLVMATLPPVLIMSLARFKFNLQTLRTDKLNYRVEFPERLDMGEYTEAHVMALQRAAGEDEEIPHEPRWYELVGCVTHQGTASAGHYFSFAKHGGEWHKLNDERVSTVTFEELQSECSGDGTSNTSAYMLVYRAEAAPTEQAGDAADEAVGLQPSSTLQRTTTLRAEIDTENKVQLRRAELFDRHVMGLMLELTRVQAGR